MDSNENTKGRRYICKREGLVCLSYSSVHWLSRWGGWFCKKTKISCRGKNKTVWPMEAKKSVFRRGREQKNNCWTWQPHSPWQPRDIMLSVKSLGGRRLEMHWGMGRCERQQIETLGKFLRERRGSFIAGQEQWQRWICCFWWILSELMERIPP